MDCCIGCSIGFLFRCITLATSQQTQRHTNNYSGSRFTPEEQDTSRIVSEDMTVNAAQARIEIEVPYPTAEEYREKAKHAFYFKRNENNAKIWSTCYTSRIGYLKPIVENARSERKKLIILTGTHGSASGNRTTNMRDPKMYQAKIKAYVEEGEHRCEYVQVVDICALKDKELETLLKGKTDVIVSFCYSRNDAEIRRILNRPARKSYIKPVERLWEVVNLEPKVRIVVNETEDPELSWSLRMK